MPPAKSRREQYSEATRAALLEQATALFAEHGYAGTSLEQVAVATQVTRGAVYHHFDSKQALFEAVLAEQEQRVMADVVAAATATDPWEATMQGLDTFLDGCCDPAYGRLVWHEGPAALGWHRWRECEKKYAYGLVEGFVHTLIRTGYIAEVALESQVNFAFWMLGGAGLAISEAPLAEKRRVRDEWAALIRRTMEAQRIK